MFDSSLILSVPSSNTYQIGSLSSVQRVEPFGHVIHAIDVDARVVCSRASLWVDTVGTFESDSNGAITIPFSAQEQDVTCVLSSGRRACVFKLVRRAQSSQLLCTCFIGTEALVQGNRQLQVF